LFGVVDEALLRMIARDETHLLLLRELSPTSYITIPLYVRDRLLGLLVFATTISSSRKFTGRDLGLAYQVGRRAALAVDHAVVFQQAEQAARARDVMMAVVSHDLKNPLSTISMAVNFLLEHVIPDDTSRHIERQQLAAVQRAAERAFRLIRDLLDVTAIEAGQLAVGLRQHHPVASVLEEAADMLGPLAAAKRINLLVEMQKELPMISADRDRLLQVFSNLGGNAIKFTPELGRVTIGARPAGDLVEFSVSDTGPGIAESDLPHVFDRFWRATKTAHIGTGLGLAIAKGIVEAHGGQISVSSTIGSGTEFVFSVPVARAE
jgi:signal transduction histidine kinase